MKSFIKGGLGKVVTDYGAKVMDVIKKGNLGRSVFSFFGVVKADAIQLPEMGVPGTPSENKGGVIYVKGDGKPYFKSSTTSETELTQSGGNAVFKRNDSTHPTSVADFTQSGLSYDFILTNFGSTQQALFTLNNANTGIFRSIMSRTTQLTFNIASNSFVLKNSSGNTVSTTQTIGASNQLWQANCQGFAATISNLAGGTLTSGQIDASTNRSSNVSNIPSVLAASGATELASMVTTLSNGTFRDGISQNNFDIYYPNDSSWETNGGYKTLPFILKVDDSSGALTQSETFLFYNKKYYGFHDGASIDASGITALSSENITNQNSLNFSQTTISAPSSLQFLYYCYPARYGDGQTGSTSDTNASGTGSSTVMSFKLNTLDATFAHLTSSVKIPVTINGYVEDYEVYRSPQAYDANTVFEAIKS